MNINYFNDDYFVSKYIDTDVKYLDLQNNVVSCISNNNKYFIEDVYHNTIGIDLSSTNNIYKYYCKNNYNYIEIRACIFIYDTSHKSATPLDYETLNTITINDIEYNFYNNYTLNVIVPIPENKIIQISKSTSRNLYFYSFFTEFNY